MERIALDISPLFARGYGRCYRTGVYRYCKHLLSGLIERAPYSLSLVNHFDPVSEEVELYHSLFQVYLPPPSIKHNPKIKKVITIHDLIAWLYPEYYPSNSKDVRNVVRAVQGNWILVPSEATKRDLVEHLCVDPQRIFTTYCGVNQTLFQPKKDPKVLEKYGLLGKPYFLFVGLLDIRKGVDLLLKAFKDLVLQENIEDLNIVLCGPLTNKYPELYWAYEHVIRKYNLESRVLHFPFIPDEDLPVLYSHALALTFLSHYEGFGLPPLEAMQCETPSICFKNSSIPEVVGETGLLLEDKRIETIASGMLKLYSEPKLVEELGKRGPGQAKKFTWDATVERTLLAYQAILAADE